MKNPSEYIEKCDDCSSTGSPTHARVFYKKIHGKWMHLCSQCWDAHNDSTTSLAKPSNAVSVEAMELDYNGHNKNKL